MSGVPVTIRGGWWDRARTQSLAQSVEKETETGLRGGVAGRRSTRTQFGGRNTVQTPSPHWHFTVYIHTTCPCTCPRATVHIRPIPWSTTLQPHRSPMSDTPCVRWSHQGGHNTHLHHTRPVPGRRGPFSSTSSLHPPTAAQPAMRGQQVVSSTGSTSQRCCMHMTRAGKCGRTLLPTSHASERRASVRPASRKARRRANASLPPSERVGFKQLGRRVGVFDPEQVEAGLAHPATADLYSNAAERCMHTYSAITNHAVHVLGGVSLSEEER